MKELKINKKKRNKSFIFSSKNAIYNILIKYIIKLNKHFLFVKIFIIKKKLFFYYITFTLLYYIWKDSNSFNNYDNSNYITK